MKDQTDLSHPLMFFGILGLLSIIGYRVEQLVGIEVFIKFALWAAIIGYVFLWVKKHQFTYNHPATFFAYLFAFTVIGYYLEKNLNIETFVLLTIWLATTLITWSWLKRGQSADKRLFYVLGMQFIALVFIMIALLHCANPELHAVDAAFKSYLLSMLIKFVTVVSLIVSIRAFVLGRRQPKCEGCC